MIKVIKKAFVVIGKEGSTLDGAGFIQKLWDDANGHFSEVAHLAKKDTNGNIVGIWGAMSDGSHTFNAWEDSFSKGLYLAGVECSRLYRPSNGKGLYVFSDKRNLINLYLYAVVDEDE